MKLRCYCCGELIGDSIALVANATSDAVDRVFVMIPDHAERTDNTDCLLVVAVPGEGDH